MINLRSIARTEGDDISTIIDEKYRPAKTVLLRLKTKIQARYVTYLEIESNKRLTSIAFTDEEKEALSSLYESKTKTARIITNGILGMLNPTHADRCLYCGIGEIDQLDHYLPIEHFPEFAILHKNLIPICGTCNQIKNDSIPGQNGKDYLHLIYDTIPLHPIFACSITYINHVPQISFTMLPAYRAGVLYRHFNDLNLKKRVEKKAVQYCLQIKALKEEFGRTFALDELARDSQKSIAFFGSFFWKTVLINQMTVTNYVDQIN
jgi:hypothetical protein